MTRSLTQGAVGFRQTTCPCFVVALRARQGGDEAVAAAAGRGRGLGRALT